jgi:hypothetical protein
MRLGLDGGAVLLKGSDETADDTGAWRVEGDRLCRDWQKIEPRHACFAVVANGTEIELCDRHGLMVIDVEIADK